ncbi:response regulator transcription factor [uncultured Brevundimonas sp.]|uniref:response regulator n=1 Tax=uncultured Brevundimonas sp. TaxID=213418 RepID=UPI00262E4383|nr:response regulator transcription factor [uncultured Brevundimonas sp.]
MIRIGILEDSVPVREHFIHILGLAEDMEVYGVATCLAELPAVLDAKPDLILTDLGLPDGSGLDHIQGMRDRGIASLVITAFGDKETVLSALNAGANGYLLKDTEDHAVLEGIRVTLQGGAPISASAAAFLLQELRRPAEAAPQAKPEPAAERLTPRETELLTLFSRGHSYKSAARELGISPLTVGDHVKAIYRKLSVNSRGEAVFAAVQRGQLRL